MSFGGSDTFDGLVQKIVSVPRFRRVIGDYRRISSVDFTIPDENAAWFAHPGDVALYQLLLYMIRECVQRAGNKMDMRAEVDWTPQE